VTASQRPLTLAQVLFSQGFGSRRECAALIARGQVRIAGQVVDDPGALIDTAGLMFTVAGQSWPFCDKALILLHKPAGYECSMKPGRYPSVMSLLPPPLRQRGVQPVGRLDADTTGVLILTDDGALNHRLTSPKHHVTKVYEVTCKHAPAAALVPALLAGVVLDDDPTEPVRAAACEATGDLTLRLTLTEGRYHQVKRMVAAAGNRCEALHRSAFGPWTLPASLVPGAWQWLPAVQTEHPPL
jgi:16S rRNA pseudouridine516 synthase